jgi:tetratricopeptide (TPR) repeat protein
MESFLKARMYTNVVKASEALFALEAKSGKPLRTLAQARFESRDYREAIANYRELEAIDTMETGDWRRLGLSYSETGRDSIAATILERAIAMDSTEVDIYGELGAVFMRLKKYANAAAAFRTRYTLDTLSTSSYVNFALSSMAIERWTDAAEALRRAIMLKPDYLPAHLNLARCLIRTDSLTAASEKYRTVIQLADTGFFRYRIELGEAYGIVGLVELLDKRYKPAIESLEQSIKFKSDNPQTHLWLAQALALSNRREESIREYRVVLKLDPKNKDAKKGLELLGQ